MKNRAEELLQAAYALLQRRDYSEQELRQRLSLIGYGSVDIDGAIQQLCKCRYIDDEAFCRHLFAKYEKTGRYGINKILWKLQQKGFLADTINRVKKDYDMSKELMRARDMVQQKQGLTLKGDHAIGRFLQNKGFENDVICIILEKILHNYE